MLYSLLIVDYSNTRVAHTGCRYDAGINTFDTANVGQLNELLFPSIHISIILGVLQWPLRSDFGKSD